VAFKIPISVLVVLFASDGRFLLLHRADRPGFWQSVTGSVDALDEPLHLAAQREVQEETGFELHFDAQQTVLSTIFAPQPWALYAWPQAVEYDIYPHWRHRYAPGVVRNTEHWFAGCVPTGELPKLSPREHVGHVWLPAQAAAAQCFSPNNAQAIVGLERVVRLI
jgi:dATP pyrophosphohydrolase